MSKEEIPAEVIARVEWLYSRLARHPHMFAGRPGCIEAFVLAIESLLDGLSNETRENSYSNFCSFEKFGAERFSLRFERLHNCRLGFIAKEQREIIAIAEDTETNFQEKFENHWTRFLQWRESGHSVEKHEPEEL